MTNEIKGRRGDENKDEKESWEMEIKKNMTKMKGKEPKI